MAEIKYCLPGDEVKIPTNAKARPKAGSVYPAEGGFRSSQAGIVTSEGEIIGRQKFVR
ncbi:MAG TPA: hypothetical protein V6C97_03355 [Oculatellaceae cyanobacterium]